MKITGSGVGGRNVRLHCAAGAGAVWGDGLPHRTGSGKQNVFNGCPYIARKAGTDFFMFIII